MVVVVVHYPLPHPVWSCPLVGYTDFHRDLRHADVGDNRLTTTTEHLSERNARFLPVAITCAEKQKLRPSADDETGRGRRDFHGHFCGPSCRAGPYHLRVRLRLLPVPQRIPRECSKNGKRIPQ